MSRAEGNALGTAGLVDDEDPPGERRLSRAETVFWYGLAGVTYIAAGIFQKSLLNWFVGPAWLVAFVWFGPTLTDPLRARFRRRRQPRRRPPEETAE